MNETLSDGLELEVRAATDDLARWRALRQEWREALNLRNDARLALDEFLLVHGSEEAIAARRAEGCARVQEKRSEANFRLGLVDLLQDARELFLSRRLDQCPACEQSLEDRGNLLERLGERIREAMEGVRDDRDLAEERAAACVAEVDAERATLAHLRERVGAWRDQTALLRIRAAREVGAFCLADADVATALDQAIQARAAERTALLARLDALQGEAVNRVQ